MVTSEQEEVEVVAHLEGADADFEVGRAQQAVRVLS